MCAKTTSITNCVQHVGGSYCMIETDNLDVIKIDSDAIEKNVCLNVTQIKSIGYNLYKKKKTW